MIQTDNMYVEQSHFLSFMLQSLKYVSKLWAEK